MYQNVTANVVKNLINAPSSLSSWKTNIVWSYAGEHLLSSTQQAKHGIATTILMKESLDNVLFTFDARVQSESADSDLLWFVYTIASSTAPSGLIELPSQDVMIFPSATNICEARVLIPRLELSGTEKQWIVCGYAKKSASSGSERLDAHFRLHDEDIRFFQPSK